MILKIAEAATDGWWIYDKISRVYTQTLPRGCDLVKETKAKYSTFDPCAGSSDDPEKVIRISTIRETCFGEDEQAFLVDTRAYLCNDEGKTIEKLTPQ